MTDTYIICLRDDYVSNEINNNKIKLFFDPGTNIEQLYAISDLVSLIKAPSESICGTIKNGIINMDGNVLNGFSSEKITDVVSVYLILESKCCDVKNWISLYEKNDEQFYRYVRQKIFYSYNKLSGYLIENKLLSLISNISDNSCWLNKKIGSSELFESRRFCSQNIPKRRMDNLPDLRMHITELLSSNSLSEKEKLYLTCNLLINERYYYFVINNSIVLAHIKCLIDKYSSLFRYLWNYTWMFMCDDDYRNVLDIATAVKLPNFNPISSDMMDNNIVDLLEFRKRLNILTSGDPNINIFANMKWKNTVVCGEVMSMAMCRNDMMPDNDLNIDIVCNHSNITEYIDHAQHIYQTFYINLQIRPKDIKLVSKKCLSIFINVKILKKKCNKQEIPFTFDYVIANVDNLDVKHYFYKLYVMQKHNNDVSNLVKLNAYSVYDIIKLVDINNVNVIIDNYSKTGDDPAMTFCDMQKEIKFVESLRYKISSKYLKHSIKIHYEKDIDTRSTIMNFCLPCMRSYYNGENCYLLPSAAVAYMTMINDDVKFIDKKQIPCHTIHKYACWGYNTKLNEFETKQYDEYIDSNGYIKPEFKNCSLAIKQAWPFNDAIDDDGNVVPVKKWLIDYAYDAIQKN